MIAPVPTLFGRMAALADPLRGRILLVLERNELTVTEIGTVFQLPQSSTSRHLKSLAEEGAVEPKVVADAILKYGIDCEKPNPMTV